MGYKIIRTGNGKILHVIDLGVKTFVYTLKPWPEFVEGLFGGVLKHLDIIPVGCYNALGLNRVRLISCSRARGI